jgi:hypothetical protein
MRLVEVALKDWEHDQVETRLAYKSDELEKDAW